MEYYQLRMRRHLAIFSKEGSEAIFSGNKTIEARFSQSRIPPYGLVDTGDLIYIKPSGHEIVGQFSVSKVISYQGISLKDIEEIKKMYKSALSFGDDNVDKTFYTKHKQAKYATLIFIDTVERFLTPPIKIPKKDLRGWVVLH